MKGTAWRDVSSNTSAAREEAGLFNPTGAHLCPAVAHYQRMKLMPLHLAKSATSCNIAAECARYV